ncbi:MAG: cobyric acid synthase [Anaerolineae bacterium]|nr:cobyric acid synthase [Anaerolineae bacterium]
MAKTLMIQGTASSAGKSLLAAALCRIFRQDGVRVAPFKAQNMALNSFVTRQGHEMGRAQVVQAQAAGLEPHVDMNPILLKPEQDARSQVVVMGKPWTTLAAGEYYRRKGQLWSVVTAALDRLRERYDLVVIEGAGSSAEINLRESDIVNMAVARYAGAPVLLVGDIDRGGVFASLVGTMVLLEKEERRLIKGFVINKFRGDVALLQDGLTLLEKRTGVPVLGVVPFIRGLQIAEEDSVALGEPLRRLRIKPSQGCEVDIAVVRLPRISNFDDFDALALEEGVQVRFVDGPGQLGHPQAIILPGTKSTIADLLWLRRVGLAKAIYELADNGIPVVGICGGYQMLGRTISDPNGVESAEGQVEGLGLLPVDTIFETVKATCQARARIETNRGFFAEIEGQEIEGYEIHMGHSRGGEPPFRLLARSEQPVDAPDGAVDERGRVFGTYLHGLFDNPNLRRAWLRSLGWDAAFSGLSMIEVREQEYDRLAQQVRESLDMERVYQIVGLQEP